MSEYYYSNVVEKKEQKGLSIASLVCGLVAFCCCNPLYSVSIVAIILGAIGCGKGGKGMAITGIILGALSIVFSILVDIILFPFTYGVGFFI